MEEGYVGKIIPMVEALNAQLTDLQALKPDRTNKKAKWGISHIIDKILKQKEQYCHQRAKVNWFKVGDMNTHFFHVSATSRNRRNWILKLNKKSDEV